MADEGVDGEAEASDDGALQTTSNPGNGIDVLYDSRRRLHQWTDARKTPQKLPLPPFFGTFGAASRRDGSLSKTLQHYEIRHDQCWAGPIQEPSGYRCTETATPISADCSLSHVAQNGTLDLIFFLISGISKPAQQPAPLARPLGPAEFGQPGYELVPGQDRQAGRVLQNRHQARAPCKASTAMAPFSGLRPSRRVRPRTARSKSSADSGSAPKRSTNRSSACREMRTVL